MILAQKVAKYFLAAFLITIIIAMLFDFMVYMVYDQDALTQIYLAGQYVSNIPADPTQLALGKVVPADDETIMREFGKFANATFLQLSEGRVSVSGTNTDMVYTFHVNKYLIKNIWIECKIITYNGVKGVKITLDYQIDPLSNLIGKNDLGLILNAFKVRNFRLIGG